MFTTATAFPSYQEALEFCGSNYSDNDIVDVVLKKTLEFIYTNPKPILDPDPICIIAIAIMKASQNGKKTVTVLDFGGACGLHFYLVKKIIKDIDIKWVVVETEEMICAAKETIKMDGLFFSSSINEAINIIGTFDVVHASGSVQYTPSPEETLENLIEVAAPIMAINRLPLFTGERTVTVNTSKLSQHGPGPMPANIKDREIRVPVTLVNVGELEKILLNKYSLESHFSSKNMGAKLGEHSIVGANLLLKRKNN